MDHASDSDADSDTAAPAITKFQSTPHGHISLLQTLSPPTISHSSPAWSISFTVDAQFIAVCFGSPDACVKIWRQGAGSWHPFATLQGHARSIRDVEFAPLSSLVLATAGFDGMVTIWEGDSTDDGECSGDFQPIAQLEGHDNEVKHVAWNQTGSLLASCGRDKTVWVWECFLPGTVGGGLANCSDRDDGDFDCLAVLQGHDGDVKSIAFAPSHGQFGEGEEILLSASYDNSIKVWAEESGDWYCAATLGQNSAIPRSPVASSPKDTHNNSGGAVHTSTVWCLGINPGGVRFLSGSEDGSIAIWKMYTASERKQRFLHDQRSTDGMWNCVGILPDAHESFAVLSVDCAPSRAGHGRIVSGGGDNSIRVYREVNGSSDDPKFAVDAMANYAHDGDVNCVKWHPRDGMSLVSCGDDGAVKVWSYVQG